MPRSIACDYCGADIEPGTGTMFVRLNGQTVHFCSSKCEKNADLGREARDLEWTEAGRGTGGEAAETTEVAPTDEQRDTDLEDQGQDVDAVDDVEADIVEGHGEDDVEPDAADDASEESTADESEDEETEEAQA